MWMRGGTSKGGYFLADDIPGDPSERDELLLKVMGSPDDRQINGMGGADPLTSKVAVVSKSKRPGIDVDYLFLQVSVDRPLVSTAQNCGNILAGVGPFAIERGLKAAKTGVTQVSIFMENTGQIALATVKTPNGQPSYEGDANIDGVPGTSAPILLEFKDTQGSTCGALLPTGQPKDVVEGTEVTMIDNGMPCIILRAKDVGVSGYEGREELEGNVELRAILENIRLHCGHKMNLGDVKDKTIPKVIMVSAPKHGGAICTRSFIPHRCHASVGVLAGVTVGTAALLEGSSASELAVLSGGDNKTVGIEHPTGMMTVVVSMNRKDVESAAVLRTANKLMDGLVF